MFKRLAIILSIAIVAGLCLLHFNRASSKDAFLGDSITQQWPFPRVNDGIYGQTSAQILSRTDAELKGHAYAKVFILAGTNDVLLGVDPSITMQNIETIALESQNTGAQPVLATLPPIFVDGGRHLPAVQALNANITQLAEQHHWPLVDYYSALRNHPNELVGGLHMKHRSYLRMEIALLRTANPF